MTEIVSEPMTPQTEIDNLLTDVRPIGGTRKGFVQRSNEKPVESGIKVSITTREEPEQTKMYWLSVVFPKDEMSRYTTVNYDLTNRKYSQLLYDDDRAGEPVKPKNKREMTPQDDTECMAWLEKFKTAPKEGSDETG